MLPRSEEWTPPNHANKAVEVDIKQRTPEWYSLRRECYTASEAPIIMGVSPYMGVFDLLQIKIGAKEEESAGEDEILERGLEAESLAKEVAEDVIGDFLYSPVLVREERGLKLLASLDGITPDWSIMWEHKLYNKKAAFMIAEGRIPERFVWQLEHQLLVTGASKALLMLSDIARRIAPVYVWYSSVPERREELIERWVKFDRVVKEWASRI